MATPTSFKGLLRNVFYGHQTAITFYSRVPKNNQVRNIQKCVIVE